MSVKQILTRFRNKLTLWHDDAARSRAEAYSVWAGMACAETMLEDLAMRFYAAPPDSLDHADLARHQGRREVVEYLMNTKDFGYCPQSKPRGK